MTRLSRPRPTPPHRTALLALLLVGAALSACGEESSGGLVLGPGPGKKDTGTVAQDTSSPDTTTMDVLADAGSTPDGVEPTEAGATTDTVSDTTTPQDGTVTPDVGPDALPPEDAGPVDVYVEPPPECTVHADCPGLQTCKTVCKEPAVCLDTEDCYGGKTCARAQCTTKPAGCATDKDCKGGYCNPAVGKCADIYPCVSDASCTGSHVCAGDTCVECASATDCPPAALACQFNVCVGSTTCGTDADCLFGLACTDGLCSEPIPAPDSFEPNDAPDNAVLLTAAHWESLTIDSGDPDWYRIDVPADTALLVRLDFDDTNGQLDLELLHGTTQTLVSKDDREAPFAVVGAGLQTDATSFLLHVIHVSGVVPEYALTVYLSPKGFCINDSLDTPVNNDNQTFASVLSGDDFDSDALAVCPGDEDWFKVKKPTAYDLTVTATYPPGQGELEITVISADDNTLGKVTGVGGVAMFAQSEVPSGTWYIRIRGETEDTASPYALSISAKEVGFCEPDGFEPNDIPDKAKPLDQGLKDNLTVCPDDEDWYSTLVPEDSQARATISYSEVDGYLGLAALAKLDPQEVIEESLVPEVSNGVAAHEVLAKNLDDEIEVLLRVERLASTKPFPITPYIMTLEIEPIPCEEEETEENDSPEDATALAPTGEGPIEASFCLPDPADWYKVHLTPGQPLDIDLAYKAKKGKLVLNLYDPNGLTLLAKGAAKGKVGSTIHMTVPPFWPEGDYLLLITGTTDLRYTLTVETDPETTDCPEGDDAYEPNDTLLHAAKLTLGETADLEICPEDPDFFTFDLTAGPAYQVTVKLLSPEPKLDIKLVEPTGKTLVKKTVTESFDVFSLAELVKESGAYYVVVGAQTPQTYSLKVSKL